MSRVTSTGVSVLAFAGGVLLAATLATAATPDFAPALRSEIPHSVRGTFQIVAPDIAIVIDHSASMIESMRTSRADFVTADLFVKDPTANCNEALGECRCTSSDPFTRSNDTVLFPDDVAKYGNPYHFFLSSGSDTTNPPTNGAGWFTPDVYDVNSLTVLEALEGPPYSLYFRRMFPDISQSAPGSSCSNQVAAKAVWFTDAVRSAFKFPPTPPALRDYLKPLSQPAIDGIQHAADSINDQAVFPFDYLSVPLPYKPAQSDPAPNAPERFPYVDSSQAYNYPLRQQPTVSGQKSLYKNSKIRSAVCAVAALAGLDNTSSIGASCLGDGVWTNKTGAKDDFFSSDVGGKANLGVYKTFQTDPGWYAPLNNVIGDRKERSFRIIDFYPPNSDINGDSVAECTGASPQDRDECQRSALFLAPDVARTGLLAESRFPDCLGLGRVAGDGVAKALAGSPGFETALQTALSTRYGIPGGVSGVAGILRDLYTNDSASTLPVSGVGVGGFWGNDTSTCSAKNNLILITDGLDSCTGAKCTCTEEGSPPNTPAQCNTLFGAGNWTDDSSTDRLPGYLTLGVPPVGPFTTNCPSKLAATMKADASKLIQTFVIGLDAGLSVADKDKLTTLASQGGTGNYYPASDFGTLTTSLKAVFSNITNQGKEFLSAGTFSINFAPSNSNLPDVVIDALFQPKDWLGELRTQRILPGGRPGLMWTAGEKLGQRNIAPTQKPRRIYTSVDKQCDGKIQGDDELIPFDLFLDDDPANPTQWNQFLLTAGGTYGIGAGGCAGASPRVCLDNAHSTGAPFFLATDTLAAGGVVGYMQTSGVPRVTCDGAPGRTGAGLDGVNRDGTASGLVSYIYGYDNPTDNPDCSHAQYLMQSAPVCAAPGAGYRPRNFQLGGATTTRWLLGDIVGSSPVTVGESNGVLAFDTDTDQDGRSDYTEFQKAVRNRPRVVYVGANDGMLHAFNVDGSSTVKVRNVSVTNKGGDEAGGEIFAYIPNAILQKLKRHAHADYGTDTTGKWIHEPSVDLTARIFDAKIYSPIDDGPPLRGWRTILVIGARAGGHYYVALDITDPSETILVYAGPRYADRRIKYPNLLWEFTEFNDTGHSASGNPVEGDATKCDTWNERTDDNPNNGNPECEDNGMDDGLRWDGSGAGGPWFDRLGESWSRPEVTRMPSGTRPWAIWLVSGPNTRDNTSKSQSSQDANNDFHGFLWALDVATGQPLDIGGGAGNPKPVTDPCVETNKQDNNAGPVSGYSGFPTQNVSPFRTSPVSADISPDNDATTNGPTVDVLYWGDLAGRLWRANVAGNTAATSVLYQPEGSNNCNGMDVERPVVGRPALTLQSLASVGGQNRVWVYWSEGALDFDSRDIVNPPNFYRDEYTDSNSSQRAYRLFGAIDTPGLMAAGNTLRYEDGNDETVCPLPGGNFTPGSCTNGSTGVDHMLDRTCCGKQGSASGCDMITPDLTTNKGGMFVCLQTDPSLLPINVSPKVADTAIGRGRVQGSPAVAASSVVADVVTPYQPPTSRECFNGWSSRILAFDNVTGNASNWTVQGGAESAGTDSKYYIPPENPVTGQQGTEANRSVATVAPAGAAADFLRYEQITGTGTEGTALPPIPMDTLYWKEVF